MFDSVCHMRMTKPPDPKENGNAGSFFKNLVISSENAKVLLAVNGLLPCITAGDGSEAGRRVAIDQCQLKGTAVGGAAVHRQQALVLIGSTVDATSDDVVATGAPLRQQVVRNLTWVWLEPEVRFMVVRVKRMLWRLSREGQYHPVNPDYPADGEFHSGEQVGEQLGHEPCY